jgi:hypothetical protein
MKNMLSLQLGTLALGAASLTLCAAATTAPASSQSLPALTAIPVSFVQTVDAKKAKVGDMVTAKTMQVVQLPGGASISKGSLVEGHVVVAAPFRFDSTPYAHQRASEISIHFDKVRQGDLVIPVNLSVRAIATKMATADASSPHHLDDTDTLGVITLIGGTEFTPIDKVIKSESGDAIAYNRDGGVFARLMPSSSLGAAPSVRCAGTDTEQSVAIFSPDACGAYGFGGDYMAQNGDDGSGTFTLTARGRSAKLSQGFTALLQVNQAK